MITKYVKCGYPRSGNVLLQNLLSEIYRRNAEGETLPIYMLLDGEFHYSELSGKIAVNYRPVEKGSFRQSLKNSSAYMIWTHDLVSNIERSVGDQGADLAKFYIVRDGRAAVHSRIHYVVRDDQLMANPAYKYRTIEEVYGDHKLFERYARQWGEHLRDYLKFADRYHLCVLEKVTADLKRTITGLCGILGINQLEPRDMNELVSEFSFKSLNRAHPKHFRTGDNQEWVQYFTRTHKQIFKEVAGDMLSEFGYERGNQW